MTAMQTTCPACGLELPPDAPRGLCPACLFQLDEPNVADPSASSALAPASPTSGIRRFGDYELLEEIARGGMGIVYRARQVSLDRIVAVKMILFGSQASAEQVRRFRIEASAAGSLQHPNIVAVHEVGLHEGQNFMVMDYVDGPNLARIVQDQPLPAKKAAAYLKPVAEAVQFAHDRGILHRDLKPSNVLIGSDDRPRVTDFGLAKRFGVRPSGGSGPAEAGTPSLDMTLSGHVIGSPNYLPPEQAGGGRQKVGRASDVYSLGAILYPLLTARPPFRAETVAETLQQVQQTEPLAPRLLNASVPRDLETICLKCLEKEPSKRYATARELAEDLGRFLNNEPIHARPVTRVERAWRWCRRKPALASALSLILILVIGSPIAVYRINEARWQAETKEKKAQQIAYFLQDMLRGVGPSVALGRDTTMLREILDQTAERISRELANQPELEAELLNTLGRVYLELGQYHKAETMHREALAVYRKRLGSENLPVADSMDGVANAVWKQGKSTEAETLYRATLAMRRKLLGPVHPDIAHSLHSLANTLLGIRRLKEAEDTYREALAMQRKLLGDQSPEVTGSLVGLALVLMGEGQLAEAEGKLREALKIQTKLFGSQHPHIAWTLYDLAVTLHREGNLAEAETTHREALTMRRKILGDAHPDVALSLQSLADLLSQEGKLAEAEAAYHEALAIRRKLTGNEDLGVAGSLHNCADVLRREGKLAEAEAFYAEALAIRRKLFGNEHRDTLGSLQNLADLLIQEGKTAEAAPLLSEALVIHSKLSGGEDLERTKP